MPTIHSKLEALARSQFRAKFHLGAKEREIVGTKGIQEIRRHGLDLIAKRLAPANPANDGKRTPFRGHPVFVAQHATATCCRTCLLRWHKIGKGKELTQPEIAQVLDLIEAWIIKDLGK